MPGLDWPLAQRQLHSESGTTGAGAADITGEEADRREAGRRSSEANQKTTSTPRLGPTPWPGRRGHLSESYRTWYRVFDSLMPVQTLGVDLHQPSGCRVSGLDEAHRSMESTELMPVQ